ncbi:hypothetical protein J5N97_016721 [Dioscorea zingiberensis]|uniref:Aminotransferase-like plant mobile domain-containing protein n=1 Tax=Dioscorea zingiberensis TaxID=325984 RepID=A0A9D5CK30_9LILI|nr:hypothetical protein J5N97_016721 [Dioscorea zingiberensis]
MASSYSLSPHHHRHLDQIRAQAAVQYRRVHDSLTSRVSRFVCAVFLTVLSIVGVIFFILWLALRPHRPHFYLSSLSVPNLDPYHSPISFTVSDHNPNHNIGIFCDSIDATVFFNNIEVGSVPSLSEPFYQPPLNIIELRGTTAGNGGGGGPAAGSEPPDRMAARDEQLVALNPGPVDGSILTLQSRHRSQDIGEGKTLSRIRLIEHGKAFSQWTVTDGSVLTLLRDAGMYYVSRLSRVVLDHALLRALIERWRPETQTFHFRMHHKRKCGRFAWGAAVLAHVYRELGKVSLIGHTDCCCFLALVQLWAWEYLPSVRPQIFAPIENHREGGVQLTESEGQLADEGVEPAAYPVESAAEVIQLAQVPEDSPVGCRWFSMLASISKLKTSNTELDTRACQEQAPIEFALVAAIRYIYSIVTEATGSEMTLETARHSLDQIAAHCSGIIHDLSLTPNGDSAPPAPVLQSTTDIKHKTGHRRRKPINDQLQEDTTSAAPLACERPIRRRRCDPNSTEVVEQAGSSSSGSDCILNQSDDTLQSSNQANQDNPNNQVDK